MSAREMIPYEEGAHPARKPLLPTLAAALWPVVLVGAATLYLQFKLDSAAAAAAERPRVVIVDDIALMEEALAEGADGSADELKVAFRKKLEALMDENTVVVSRYSVLAVSPGTLIESVPVRRDYAAPPAPTNGAGQ